MQHEHRASHAILLLFLVVFFLFFHALLLTVFVFGVFALFLAVLFMGICFAAGPTATAMGQRRVRDSEGESNGYEEGGYKLHDCSPGARGEQPAAGVREESGSRLLLSTSVVIVVHEYQQHSA